MNEHRDNFSLLVGVLVSVLVHVGVGVGAARYGTFSVTSGAGVQGEPGALTLLTQDEAEALGPEELIPPPPPPIVSVPEQAQSKPDVQSMRLGIRESSQESDAWLGFNEPSPHSGALSAFDQAQLSLQPGDAGVPGDASAAMSAQAPSPPASAGATAAVTTMDLSQPRPEPAAAPQPMAEPRAVSESKPQANAPVVDQPESQLQKTTRAETMPAPTPADVRADEPRDGDPRGDTSTVVQKPLPDVAPTPASEAPARAGKGARQSLQDEQSQEPEQQLLEDALRVSDGVMLEAPEVRPDPLLPAAALDALSAINPLARAAAPPEAEPPALLAMPTLDPLALVTGPGQTPAPSTEMVTSQPGGENVPPANPSVASMGSAGGAKASPGNLSDRESDAASKKGPIEVRPGRPAAGQGLEIQTVRPRWSITVRLTSAPRNPLVRIVFGPDGRVKSAAFLGGQNTGSDEVDGPLLDAIYRWTAKGKAIDELPKDDPRAGVPLIMRVVLRN